MAVREKEGERAFEGAHGKDTDRGGGRSSHLPPPRERPTGGGVRSTSGADHRPAGGSPRSRGGGYKVTLVSIVVCVCEACRRRDSDTIMLHPGPPMADKVALGWEGPARVVTRCSNASRRCWHAARCHGAICTSRLARPRCCSHAARLAAIGSASVNAQHSLGSGGDGAAGAAAKAMPSSLCATGA